MSASPLSFPSASIANRQALVFDSGVGGLSVAHEIRALLPDLPLLYVADSAFFPYGDKSDQALINRLPSLLRDLTAKARADVVVIACNTASTIALEEIRAALCVPVIGTVPAIKPAAAQSRARVIGLLATPGTIARPYTDRLIETHAKDCRVLRHGSQDLVRLAEHFMAGEAVSDAALSAAIAPLRSQPDSAAMDVIVLACTHFPLLRSRLAELVGPDITFVDSGAAIARRTREILTALPALDAQARKAPRLNASWFTGDGPSPTLAYYLDSIGLPARPIDTQ